MAGELQAARRIQMGILPAPAAVLRGDDRIALYAFLEPARIVGGDLYDFFRLDGDRLFFLVGDVSGHGVAGSLFMAVSKALCKSAALRSGDLGAMMRESNARDLARQPRGAVRHGVGRPPRRADRSARVLQRRPRTRLAARARAARRPRPLAEGARTAALRDRRLSLRHRCRTPCVRARPSAW